LVLLLLLLLLLFIDLFIKLTLGCVGGRGGQPIPPPYINPDAAVPGDALKKYGKDITALAKEGKLDEVIGRDEEIRRTMQVLSRRTKNNPVLIGEVRSIPLLHLTLLLAKQWGYLTRCLCTAWRGQDGDRGGTGHAHHSRRRARQPQGQEGDRAGHG
jgi:hypothetical protein